MGLVRGGNYDVSNGLNVTNTSDKTRGKRKNAKLKTSLASRPSPCAENRIKSCFWRGE